MASFKSFAVLVGLTALIFVGQAPVALALSLKQAERATEKFLQRIVDKEAEWLRASQDKTFSRHFKLGGQTLSRAPRGFDKDHPLLTDIKRKDFIAIKNLELGAATQPKFQQKVETAFRAGEPYMRFLCKAVGVPF